VAKTEKKTRQKKKPKNTRRDKNARRKGNAVVLYLRRTWAELKKVRWPTRQEATNLSLIVLSVTAAMSAFLGVADKLSDLLFSFLIGISS
jgi:preprotein translocase SecE subunit